MFWVADISGKLETIIVIAELWERPASWLVFKSLRNSGVYAVAVSCCEKKPRIRWLLADPSSTPSEGPFSVLCCIVQQKTASQHNKNTASKAISRSDISLLLFKRWGRTKRSHNMAEIINRSRGDYSWKVNSKTRSVGSFSFHSFQSVSYLLPSLVRTFLILKLVLQRFTLPKPFLNVVLLTVSIILILVIILNKLLLLYVFVSNCQFKRRPITS